MYNPIFNKNQLKCGTGDVAIVTGWTPVRLVEKQLENHQYGAIGQLYSPTRGINFLVRNLLANPQINHVVLILATKEDRNSGGCVCLLDFFVEGFKKGEDDCGNICWVVNSDVNGYIGIEVEEEALHELRKRIKAIYCPTVKEAVEYTKQVNNAAIKINLPPAKTFEYKKPHSKVLPGKKYGHCVEGETIAETWVKLVHLIKTTGNIRPSKYDGKWQELIDVMAVVTDEPEDFYFPEPNYLPFDKNFIESYVQNILDDKPYDENVHYTYGQRLRSWFEVDQIKQIIKKLSDDINVTNAVMTTWYVKDLLDSASPCLNHIWLRVVENKLSLTATFRSNDMYSAWPANAMGLRALQRHILEEVNNKSTYNLTMGPLVTISQSAHIYDTCWDMCNALVPIYKNICKNRKYSDPVGNFLISIDDESIIVDHTSPGSGIILNTYKHTKAAQLYRLLAATYTGMQLEHAFYLGTELQKAETALVSGSSYTQDG